MKVFLVLAMVMAMAIALTATTPVPTEEVTTFNVGGVGDNITTTSDFMTSSLRERRRRFHLRPYNRAATTCDKYPRVCRGKGSPGPDCCKKKCVNVIKDRFNCGRCGKKCKFGQICCKGECVNVMSDKKHCGRCNNKCKKGSSCTYGMCSYA